MKVRTGSVLIIMHSFVEKILFIRSTHLMCLKVLSYNLRKKIGMSAYTADFKWRFGAKGGTCTDRA